MLTTILFIVGFVILIKGADLLVEGAVSVAGRFRVQPIVISLTVVAFGTSLPELVVNAFASSQGTSDLAISNVLGSNIANILLVLGIAAIIFPLKAQSGTVWKEVPFSVLAAVVLLAMVSDELLDKAQSSVLGRIDGVILLCFFSVFLYYLFGVARLNGDQFNEVETKQLPLWRIVVYITGGLLGLIFGGKWIVDGAVMFSRNFGINEGLVGLTIVAVGTSLPELATSAVAAYRKQADIAIGNVVGSNLFNGFWILGCSALISPLAFDRTNSVDAIANIAVSVLLFVAMFVGKRMVIQRWQGVVFVLLYGGYMALAVMLRQ